MTAEAVVEDRRADPRWMTLYVLCAGVLMIVLDATIVNVALPVIQEDLGFSQSGLAWVVNAYLIAFGGLLLLAGRLGDLVGGRQVFLAGLGVFSVASLLCGASTSQEMLVVARFVQGVGGALTMAVALGMIVTLFPEPREQAKAIGVFSFVASAGGSIGLVFGGILTDALSWHWIFLINVPIGIATAWVAARRLSKGGGIGFGEGADIPGAVLITSSLMLGVYTIVKPAAEEGWGAAPTLALGAISLALLVLFVWRQASIENPLVPLRIFRSWTVSGANLTQVFSVAGMFGPFFLGSLYMERVLGYEPLQIGLAFLPLTLAMGTMSVRYSERLIMRFGPKRCTIAGLLLIGVAVVLFALLPVDGEYLPNLFPAMVLLGLGAGTCFPAMMSLAMSGATPSDAGLAGGLVSTSAQVGGAVGLAVLATLSASRTDSLLADGKAEAAALTAGYTLAFWVASGLVGVAIAVAASLTVPKPEVPPA